MYSTSLMWFSLLIANGLTQTVFAATGDLPLSVGQVIDESLHDSLKVKAAESVAHETTWHKREAYSAFLPSISAGATYFTQKKYMLLDVNLGTPISIPQIFPTTSYTLQATVPLFDGFASSK